MPSFFEELKRRNVVRVAILYAIVGWLILQVATSVMPALGIPPWGVSLVVILVIVGFPIALMLAWAYELTPEGIKRTHEVEHHESITPLTGRKLDFLIIGVLAAALVFVIVNAYVLKRAPVNDTRTETAAKSSAITIAVLPFIDMSAAKDQEYFTDGISEELLNLLANVNEFKVAGRTSSFAFKGRNEDLREIGRKLGVANVLEGSVRKQGDQLRITAQLVKAADGYHLWSETYDRKLNDVFAIQSEIAGEVSSALKRTLLPAVANATTTPVTQRAPTDNVEAYTHYLRGQYLQRTRQGPNLDQALAEFTRATELDPKFARAYSGRALTLVLLASYGQRNTLDVEPAVNAAIDRAMALDPTLAEPYAVKSLMLDTEGKAAPSDRIALLEKAVALNGKDSQTLMWLAAAYGDAGRREDQVRAFERAYALDPLMPVLLSNFAGTLAAYGERERAERLVAELQTLGPDSPMYYNARANLASADGRIDNRVRAYAAAARLHPEDAATHTSLHFAYLELGNYAASLREAQEIARINPGSSGISQIPLAQALGGDVPGARAMLEKALAKEPGSFDLRLAYSYVLMLQRDPRAKDELLGCFPWFLKSPPEIDGGPGSFFAPEAIYLLRQSGDEAHADALARAYREWLDVNLKPAKGTERGAVLGFRAYLAAANNDRDDIVRQLTALYDTGGLVAAYYAREPMVQPHLADPRVAELMKKFDARRAEWMKQLAAEGL